MCSQLRMQSSHCCALSTATASSATAGSPRWTIRSPWGSRSRRRRQAPPLPRRPGPLAQLILDGAAAAAGGDSPFDIDEEPAFDGTAAAAADAAVELTGGDGHPLPDDWMLVAMGGGDAGAANDDTPADNLAVAVAVGVAVRGADSWRTPEGGLLQSQCAWHCLRICCSLCGGQWWRHAVARSAGAEFLSRRYGYALLSRLACLTSILYMHFQNLNLWSRYVCCGRIQSAGCVW